MASSVNSGSTSWTNSGWGLSWEEVNVRGKIQGKRRAFFEVATNSFVLQEELS